MMSDGVEAGAKALSASEICPGSRAHTIKLAGHAIFLTRPCWKIPLALFDAQCHRSIRIEVRLGPTSDVA